MKTCPRCGRKFSIFERAVGEAKEHVRFCKSPEKKKDPAHLAGICRGCPAGCFERVDYEATEGDPPDT